MKNRMKIVIPFMTVMVAVLLLSIAFAPMPSEQGMTKGDASTLARGEKVYNASCAACHGKSGAGDGVVSATLAVKPRNFTQGIFKFRTTEAGSLPTDADLYKTISLGIHNTGMPGFHDMPAADRYAVVQYIKTFSARFVDEDEYPLEVLSAESPVAMSASSIAAGRQIYIDMSCWECHGWAGEGDGPAAGTHEDAWGNPIAVRDLTKDWMQKASWNVSDVYMMFTAGLDGTPMPSYKETLTDEQRWNLANYVYALTQGYAPYDGISSK